MGSQVRLSRRPKHRLQCTPSRTVRSDRGCLKVWFQSSPYNKVFEMILLPLHTWLLTSFPPTGLISSCNFTVPRKCQSCIETRANSSGTGHVCMNDWIWLWVSLDGWDLMSFTFLFFSFFFLYGWSGVARVLNICLYLEYLPILDLHVGNILSCLLVLLADFEN